MRISGGTHRGRLVVVPKGAGLRPTTERVREAIFSTLFSMGVVAESRTLDLYAGSGLFGLESLSRGAARAVFVEIDRPLVQTLERQLETFSFADRSRVVNSDVAKFLVGNSLNWGGSFDLVLADPYAESPGVSLLEQLLAGDWLAAGSVVVVETAAKSTGFPEQIAGANTALSLSRQRVKRYGDTEVSIFVTV